MTIIRGVFMLMLAILTGTGGGLAQELVKLPPPQSQGKVSVEQALAQRRTIRRFSSQALDLQQLSQLLWATDGVNDPRGRRTAPSAGATFPLDLYLVAGEQGVGTLAAGVYRYRPTEQALELLVPGDLRGAVARACLQQTWMAEAPVMVVIGADYRRCTARYGERGVRYTHMEVGHAAQNLFLEAGGLGLGAGIVGAFEDQALAQTLKLPRESHPLLVMPVGYKY